MVAAMMDLLVISSKIVTIKIQIMMVVLILEMVCAMIVN